MGAFERVIRGPLCRPKIAFRGVHVVSGVLKRSRCACLLICELTFRSLLFRLKIAVRGFHCAFGFVELCCCIFLLTFECAVDGSNFLVQVVLQLLLVLLQLLDVLGAFLVQFLCNVLDHLVELGAVNLEVSRVAFPGYWACLPRDLDRHSKQVGFQLMRYPVRDDGAIVFDACMHCIGACGQRREPRLDARDCHADVACHRQVEPARQRLASPGRQHCPQVHVYFNLEAHARPCRVKDHHGFCILAEHRQSASSAQRRDHDRPDGEFNVKAEPSDLQPAVFHRFWAEGAHFTVHAETCTLLSGADVELEPDGHCFFEHSHADIDLPAEADVGSSHSQAQGGPRCEERGSVAFNGGDLKTLADAESGRRIGGEGHHVGDSELMQHVAHAVLGYSWLGRDLGLLPNAKRQSRLLELQPLDKRDPLERIESHTSLVRLDGALRQLHWLDIVHHQLEHACLRECHQVLTNYIIPQVVFNRQHDRVHSHLLLSFCRDGDTDNNADIKFPENAVCGTCSFLEDAKERLDRFARSAVELAEEASDRIHGDQRGLHVQGFAIDERFDGLDLHIELADVNCPTRRCYRGFPRGRAGAQAHRSAERQLLPQGFREASLKFFSTVCEKVSECCDGASWGCKVHQGLYDAASFGARDLVKDGVDHRVDTSGACA